jgi:hypothetical protein
MALALPEVEWLEYSYLNLEHLIEHPYEIENGYIWGSEAPGHGLVLAEAARLAWRAPQPLVPGQEITAPPQQRLAKLAEQSPP